MTEWHFKLCTNITVDPENDQGKKSRYGSAREWKEMDVAAFAQSVVGESQLIWRSKPEQQGWHPVQ